MSDDNYETLRRRLSNEAAPVEAHREAMWEVVSRAWSEQAARRKRVQIRRAWGTAGLGLAAALVLGIFVGRLSDVVGVEEPGLHSTALVADDAVFRPALPTPYRFAADEHFQAAETVLMLFGSADEADAALVRAARELAATTRLLMDSRVGEDPDVRSVLLDLELLLVQISRLIDDRDSAERRLVRESIEESGVPARLRGMLPEQTSLAGI